MADVRVRAEHISVLDDMRYYCERPQTPVALGIFQKFASHGNKQSALLEGALFLHTELPVRIAMGAQFLDKMPRGLGGLQAFQEVRALFTTSFQDVRAFNFSQPPNVEDESRFHEILSTIQIRHKRVPEAIALGCEALRAQLELIHGESWWDSAERKEIQQLLEGFFLSRVGIRFLVGQQMKLHSQYYDGVTSSNMFGLVDLQTNPHRLVKSAISSVERMAMASFGACPNITLKCTSDITFVQVAYHIKFITIRLLRHAIQNTLACYGLEKVKAGEAPGITVTVADGPDNEDLCICVMDEGGGLPRSKVRYLWSYLHEDGEERDWEWVATSEEDNQFGESFGLPLARLRARLFGGDVKVQTMESYGLLTFAYIKKFDDAELLPERYSEVFEAEDDESG
uniref:Protein-serine/threonine kinase n=1 Tax=Eutreptiella gymnastica TaxID=73025 RepID=A0A7S1J7C3_9EUGL